VVLVRESAEDLFTADRVLGEVDRFGWLARVSNVHGLLAPGQGLG
jgi:hypothetical protein